MKKKLKYVIVGETHGDKDMTSLLHDSLIQGIPADLPVLYGLERAGLNCENEGMFKLLKEQSEGSGSKEKRDLSLQNAYNKWRIANLLLKSRKWPEQQGGCENFYLTTIDIQHNIDPNSLPVYERFAMLKSLESKRIAYMVNKVVELTKQYGFLNTGGIVMLQVGGLHAGRLLAHLAMRMLSENSNSTEISFSGVNYLSATGLNSGACVSLDVWKESCAKFSDMIDSAKIKFITQHVFPVSYCILDSKNQAEIQSAQKNFITITSKELDLQFKLNTLPPLLKEWRQYSQYACTAVYLAGSALCAFTINGLGLLPDVSWKSLTAMSMVCVGALSYATSIACPSLLEYAKDWVERITNYGYMVNQVMQRGRS